MVEPLAHDVAFDVGPVAASEIRALVEPVRCRGRERGDHAPVEAQRVDSGVGFVLYECPDCGLRVLYRHATGESEPCCGPRP